MIIFQSRNRDAGRAVFRGENGGLLNLFMGIVRDGINI